MAEPDQLLQKRERADELERLATKVGRLEVARTVRQFLVDLFTTSARAKNTGQVEGRSPTEEEKRILRYVEELIRQNGATPDEIASR